MGYLWVMDKNVNTILSEGVVALICVSQVCPIQTMISNQSSFFSVCPLLMLILKYFYIGVNDRSV